MQEAQSQDNNLSEKYAWKKKNELKQEYNNRISDESTKNAV